MAEATSTLTRDETEALNALLNVVVPPDTERGLPGAADTAFAKYAEGADIIAMVRDGVSQLQREADAQFKTGFARLNTAQQADLVKSIERTNAAFFRPFMRHVVQCYYQDDRVLKGIGVEPRPPFPDGFTVAEGDLTLLEPVVERDPLYR
ncbi:MAG TPA: gluconate 2-dehydrogenase subunit 3 family protein [Gemmatimonadaceae bacterium]